MSDIAFAIGEVAAMLGLSPHTIRAWERRHVTTQPTRTPSGQRRYSAEDVELLRQIKHERHVHGHSMRVATMTAQGLLVPDVRDAGGPDATPSVAADGRGDPLRLVADRVSEVVVVVDASGHIQHANTAFVRFCDVMLGQLRGLVFADFVDPFDRAKAVQAYQAPMRTRRGWELGLRTTRRRALFSFDCWPEPSPDGSVLLLVGRQLEPGPNHANGSDSSDAAAVPAAPATNGVAEPVQRGAPAQVRTLLDGVADPVRTLELLQPWLDATPMGVVLTRTDADLTTLFANGVFRRLVPAARLPVEGRPWQALTAEGGDGRLASAAREVVGSAQRRSVLGFRPAWDDRSSPPTIWDVELCPVTDPGGAVTHLLLSVRDVSTEVAAAHRLEALAISASELRHASDARQVLTAAARHARSLMHNAGSLLAVVRDRAPGGVGVVAANGVWAQADQDGEPDLRLRLVRDVVRTGTSVEVERVGAVEAVETLRIVPLRVAPITPDGTRVLGALAFSRLDSGPFPAVDRLLMDEFAGRVGTALLRAERLGPARGRDAAAGA